MLRVIKKKENRVLAYQLGSDSAAIQNMVDTGKIIYRGDGIYEIHSRETLHGECGGEIALTGDWVKIDGEGYPYPNSKNYFEAHHSHVTGDIYEQIPEPLYAWEQECEWCPEMEFLVKSRGLQIDHTSFEKRYTAELWGTLETAAADAVIVFYSISCEKEGKVAAADFNFVERGEFERTYRVL